MHAVLPIAFDSPAMLAIAAALAAIATAVAVVRRISLPASALALLALGLVGLALAAGGMAWRREVAGRVVVMVDLSPSTRGATFRDAGQLTSRVRQLLPATDYHLYLFSGAAGAIPVTSIDRIGSAMDERSALQTVFAPPPDAAAVVLFSDGRFDELPRGAPPIYAVIDPALDGVSDASIERLERRGETIAVVARNRGDTARELTLSPDVAATGAERAPLHAAHVVPRGQHIVSSRVDPLAAVTAALSAGDAWPENDAMSLAAAPPARAERWWVAASPRPGSAWKHLSPAALPTDAAAYLAPAVVVLDNVAAFDVSAAQLNRLHQYVRDLGGSLLIIGGDRAFAAGAYDGTPLAELSPLASSPPDPAAHWMLLVDHSGSMAAERSGAGGRTLSSYALAAAADVVAQLPPGDLLSVGGFGQDLTWWVRSQPVSGFDADVLAPAPPRGPTNLEPALRAATAQAETGLVHHLLVITDGQAALDDAESLAAALRAKNVRLHVLAVGPGGAIEPMRRIAASTGGTFAEQLDAARWADAARQLVRPALPQRWVTEPVDVRPRAGSTDIAIAPARVPAWNRTWAKPAADVLADAHHAGKTVPMAARQRVGAGHVVAVAYPADPATIQAIAASIAAPPRDPRLRVAWDAGSRLRIAVDAVDESMFLNGLALTVDLQPLSSTSASPATASASHDVPQTAPGRYELSLPASREPVVATLRHDGRVVDRVAVAGRYAPEFDSVGNDRAQLERLAEQTGGRVIEPGDVRPIDFTWPRRHTPLAGPLATAAAVCIGLGLIVWRLAR